MVLVVVYSSDDDEDQRRTATRQGRQREQAEGMAGQRSQQSANKGHKRSMTSIKHKANNKHKKKAKAKAKKGRRRRSYYIYIAVSVSQNSVGIDHGVMLKLHADSTSAAPHKTQGKRKADGWKIDCERRREEEEHKTSPVHRPDICVLHKAYI